MLRSDVIETRSFGCPTQPGFAWVGVGRLIAYAYEQPTREERDRILAEMKKMLAGYLFQGLPA